MNHELKQTVRELNKATHEMRGLMRIPIERDWSMILQGSEEKPEVKGRLFGPRSEVFPV